MSEGDVLRELDRAIELFEARHARFNDGRVAVDYYESLVDRAHRVLRTRKEREATK